MYKLTRTVLVQTTGFSRSAGRQIAPGEIQNDALWQAWLDEGIVIEQEPDSQPQKPEKEEAPLPQKTGASSSEVKDYELREMGMDELKAHAKRLGIRGTHLYKSRDTLIKKIEGLS
ncbi:MAG: hypothetical protein GWO23_02210 [Gammaproteobacteria bacterium]|nr:hypothetical protein [Gammaproteobacteria bacterium]NIS49638.1 hypothetical protein [Phycisphaerae bacterium]